MFTPLAHRACFISYAVSFFEYPTMYEHKVDRVSCFYGALTYGLCEHDLFVSMCL